MPLGPEWTERVSREPFLNLQCTQHQTLSDPAVYNFASSPFPRFVQHASEAQNRSGMRTGLGGRGMLLGSVSATTPVLQKGNYL